MSTATLARPAKLTRSTARSAGGSTAVPSAPPVAALRLLMAARRVLAEAHGATDPLDRYAFSHLAALRAAASVLADRAKPSGAKSRRPTSVWTLLVGVAPELEPWARYFAAGAGKRAAAESGMRGAVTAREADDLMRDADSFVALLETMLGLLSLPEASGSDAGH